MKHKALDRAGRKATIIVWFKIRIEHDNHAYASSYEIARGLGLSASGKLRDMLREMVEDGTLLSKPMDKQGRWKGSGYMLADVSSPASLKRLIKVVSRGAVVGQMELF